MVRQDNSLTKSHISVFAPQLFSALRTLAHRKCTNGVYCSAYVRACVSKTEWKALPGHRLSHHIPSLETREDWGAFLVPRNYFTVKGKLL